MGERHLVVAGHTRHHFFRIICGNLRRGCYGETDSGASRAFGRGVRLVIEVRCGCVIGAGVPLGVIHPSLSLSAKQGETGG
jgi:hypothetical protein